MCKRQKEVKNVTHNKYTLYNVIIKLYILPPSTYSTYYLTKVNIKISQEMVEYYIILVRNTCRNYASHKWR